jgi:hypothetical protein
MENSQQLARMKFVYGDDDVQLRALLGESLAPRPPDFLFDLTLPLLTPESRLLDVGCRDARHLIPLVMRSGCTGIGIDPVERNIDRRGLPSPLQVSTKEPCSHSPELPCTGPARARTLWLCGFPSPPITAERSITPSVSRWR